MHRLSWDAVQDDELTLLIDDQVVTEAVWKQASRENAEEEVQRTRTAYEQALAQQARLNEGALPPLTFTYWMGMR